MTLKGEPLSLWFNNFSKIELGKTILPAKGGYPGKPEEVALLKVIQERAATNHLLLLTDVVHAGLVGHAYGTDSAVKFTRKELAGLVAEANEDELYNVWQTFLEAMGLNLDKIVEKAKKKAQKKKASRGTKPLLSPLEK